MTSVNHSAVGDNPLRVPLTSWERLLVTNSTREAERTAAQRVVWVNLRLAFEVTEAVVTSTWKLRRLCICGDDFEVIVGRRSEVIGNTGNLELEVVGL